MDYAGIVIKNNNGKILFQLRDNKLKIKNPNLWGIFGGGVKKGESPEQAIIRELFEELNLKLREKDLTKILTLGKGDAKKHLFLVKLNSNKPVLKLREGASMRFFSIREFLKQSNVVKNLKFFILIYPLLVFYANFKKIVKTN